jgi:hypothetical protein
MRNLPALSVFPGTTASRRKSRAQKLRAHRQRNPTSLIPPPTRAACICSGGGWAKRNGPYGGSAGHWSLVAAWELIDLLYPM